MLALKHGRVLWVESKTYLDSQGVRPETLQEGYTGPGRVRVFNDPVFRRVVKRALLRQLRGNGAISPTTRSVELGFAAWKFRNSRAKDEVQAIFDRKKWVLFDDEWLVNQLRVMATTSYRDSTAALVAKLLLRSGR